MEAKILFGGESIAINCFGKMLESREVTFGFPAETSQWTIALGESGEMANALLQTLSLNPGIEAELKRGENAMVVNGNDSAEKIEQLLCKGSAPTLMFRSVAQRCPPDNLDGDFFVKAPPYVTATGQLIEEAATEMDETKRQEYLATAHSRLQTFGAAAKLAQLGSVVSTGAAVEALLKRLCQNAKSVNPSTLNTAAHALQVLGSLCVRGVEQKLAHQPPVKILVVEDEAMSQRAIVGTLQAAFEKPDSAKDGVEALELAREHPYDVIFSDIEMPEMGGFGLSQRIREGGPNQSTPIIFITSHIDFEARMRARKSGANDFIAKPFLPIEITVKALTFAMEKRLHADRNVATPPHPENEKPDELQPVGTVVSA